VSNELSQHKQLTLERLCDASPARVWSVLSDASLLPQWAPAVHDVERCDAQETVGSKRHCRVQLGGRTGSMVERCIECVPLQRIAYAVDEDSFGMTRMFDGYGFCISLDAATTERTRIRIDTYYTPRNVLYATLNALFMRRQFRGVVRQLLEGLARISESRPGQPASAQQRNPTAE
jgi:uncharacterized protein YndB with AHSA1/START domain